MDTGPCVAIPHYAGLVVAFAPAQYFRDGTSPTAPLHYLCRSRRKRRAFESGAALSRKLFPVIRGLHSGRLHALDDLRVPDL